jgi:hypothetical protein
MKMLHNPPQTQTHDDNDDNTSRYGRPDEVWPYQLKVHLEDMPGNRPQSIAHTLHTRGALRLTLDQHGLVQHDGSILERQTLNSTRASRAFLESQSDFKNGSELLAVLATRTWCHPPPALQPIRRIFD